MHIIPVIQVCQLEPNQTGSGCAVWSTRHFKPECYFSGSVPALAPLHAQNETARVNVPNSFQLILSPSDYFVSAQAKQTAKAVAGGLRLWRQYEKIEVIRWQFPLLHGMLRTAYSLQGLTLDGSISTGTGLPSSRTMRSPRSATSGGKQSFGQPFKRAAAATSAVSIQHVTEYKLRITHKLHQITLCHGLHWKVRWLYVQTNLEDFSPEHPSHVLERVYLGQQNHTFWRFTCLPEDQKRPVVCFTVIESVAMHQFLGVYTLQRTHFNFQLCYGVLPNICRTLPPPFPHWVLRQEVQQEQGGQNEYVHSSLVLILSQAVLFSKSSEQEHSDDKVWAAEEAARPSESQTARSPSAKSFLHDMRKCSMQWMMCGCVLCLPCGLASLGGSPSFGPGPSTYKGGIPKYKGTFKIFPALARRRARLT